MTNKINTLLNFILIGMLVFVSSANAKDSMGKIKEIKVNQVESTIKSQSFDKPLIIHFSSTDGSCRPCMYDNGGMDEASGALSETYNIAAVYFNPWRDINKHNHLEEKYEVKALPATTIFYKGKIVATQAGTIKNKAHILKKFWKEHKAKK